MRPLSVRWLDAVPLTAGEVRVLCVAAPGHPEKIADCTALKFFQFSIFATTQTNVLVEGCYQSGFVVAVPPLGNNYETLISHNATASTFVSTYDLTGVFANNSGWVTLQRPYIRITLTESEVVLQTELRFYALAWG